MSTFLFDKKANNHNIWRWISRSWLGTGI